LYVSVVIKKIKKKSEVGMANVKLRTAYKIIETRHKRYIEHYQIPSAECLVVPLKSYGTDVVCEVRWEDEYGVLHSKENLLFTQENLRPINPLIDSRLYEIFQHYYGEVERVS
jgi:hypothetical protein